MISNYRNLFTTPEKSELKFKREEPRINFYLSDDDYVFAPYFPLKAENLKDLEEKIEKYCGDTYKYAEKEQPIKNAIMDIKDVCFEDEFVTCNVLMIVL